MVFGTTTSPFSRRGYSDADTTRTLFEALIEHADTVEAHAGVLIILPSGRWTKTLEHRIAARGGTTGTELRHIRLMLLRPYRSIGESARYRYRMG